MVPMLNSILSKKSEIELHNVKSEILCEIEDLSAKCKRVKTGKCERMERALLV
jgi:hypothetical protein